MTDKRCGLEYGEDRGTKSGGRAVYSWLIMVSTCHL